MSVCLACGAAFRPAPRRTASAYCSKSCHKWARRHPGETRPEVDAEAARVQSRARIQARSLARAATTCRACGEALTPAARYGTTAYCSHRCSEWARKHPGVTRVEDALARPLIRCGACGIAFQPAPRRDASEHCSKRCHKWARVHPGETRVPGEARVLREVRVPRAIRAVSGGKCKACGEALLADRGYTAYCSKRCYLWAWRHPGEPRPVARASARCVVCNIVFSPKGFRSKYCSRQCKRNSDVVRRIQAQHRASKRGARIGAPVVFSLIAERDGWRCGICRKKVNPNLKRPNPLSASLDHIIPLSKAGSHDPANVRLTHLKCNMQRGNRMEPVIQLALIG